MRHFPREAGVEGEAPRASLVEGGDASPKGCASLGPGKILHRVLRERYGMWKDHQ